MSKKKKKGKGKKKLSKQLTKQLKKVIKVHGTELALGFVTGIITKLIADRTDKSSKNKKAKKTAETKEEQSPLVTAVKETTQAVAEKVKTAIAPQAPPVVRKAPAKRINPRPVTAPEPAPEPSSEPA